MEEEDAIETGLKLVTFYLRPEVTKRGRFEATGNNEEPHFPALKPVCGTLASLSRSIFWSSEGVSVGTNAPRTEVHEFIEKFIRRSTLSDATSCGKDRHAG